VKAEPVLIGRTTVTFVREVLSIPEEFKADLAGQNINFNDNFDGSQREI